MLVECDLGRGPCAGGQSHYKESAAQCPQKWRAGANGAASQNTGKPLLLRGLPAGTATNEPGLSCPLGPGMQGLTALLPCFPGCCELSVAAGFSTPPACPAEGHQMAPRSAAWICRVWFWVEVDAGSSSSLLLVLWPDEGEIPRAGPAPRPQSTSFSFLTLTAHLVVNCHSPDHRGWTLGRGRVLGSHLCLPHGAHWIPRGLWILLPWLRWALGELRTGRLFV